MSDANDDTNDTPKTEPGARAPLSLKPRLVGNVSTGTVKQSFSHGRSKTVVVETKRRIGAPAPSPSARGGPDPHLARPVQNAPAKPEVAKPVASNTGPGGLRQEELEARRRAIEQSRIDAERREAEAREAEKLRAAQVAAAKAESPTEAPVTSVGEAPVESKPVVEAASPSPAAEAAPVAPRVNPIEAALSRPAMRAPRESYSSRTPHDRNRPEAPRSDRPKEGTRDAGRDGSRDSGRSTTTYQAGRDAPRRDPQRDATREPSRDQGRDQSRDTGRDQSRDQGRDAGRSAPNRERPAAGETVRYSANSPRPAPRTGPRGAPGLAANIPPAEPEVGRIRSSRGELGLASKTLDQRKILDDEETARGKRGKGGAAVKAVSQTRGEPKRREGRLTIQAIVGDDEDAAERMRSLASVRRAREREREKRKGNDTEQARTAREVIIPDVITVQELSNRMAVRAVDIIKMLMKQGMMLKINDVIDSDTAELVASEFGNTVKRVSESDVLEGFIDAEDHDDDTITRPPVIAIMGHVDHGKTSLLDALRKTDVASGEAGGITQHIGAYQVRLPAGERITFLDTPGHAAFSAMRARGANVTDIVVLVVAADDGVMPQTIEAINHARAAKTPMIVAINKMDKSGAKPERIINELLQHEVVVEALGGDTQVVEISAKTGLGLDNLIEALLLQAEVLDLKANPDRTAEGIVIEAKLDKGRGPVATVLVKRGTLKRGDIVVAGSSFGRVRALINERNEQLDEAGPAEPVEILGLNGAPDPGDAFAVVENEARAREITEYRERQRREKSIAPVGAAVSLSDMMSQLADKKVKELRLVIKSDVQGSSEAIVGSLDQLATDEVRARIIHSAAGAITESDVQLAKGSNAPIIGFNVRASKQARDLAEREGVEIRYYAIIYDLIDDVKGVLSGMLAPIQRETFLGNAEILEVFDITKVGKVAGCIVKEGKMQKGARIRILRDDIVIQEMGLLSTLKRFKDEVNEVQVSQECGMAFNGFQDLKKGDFIECFTVEEIKRTL